MRPTCPKSGPIAIIPIFCFLFSVLLCSLAANPVRAAENAVTNLILILDSSGSMAAQIKGKAKIAVAKEVMSDFIKNLPAGIDVGLVAYGHRQKNDCKDVEELAPLGHPDKDALLEKIKSMQPKGMTPITYSVRMVAEGLKGVEGDNTIVLVSDGEETCKEDPCALVKELKAAGAKFILHVIGFDVGEKEKAQLSCIAQAGGGQYFTAKDASELLSATQKVVEKAEQSSSNLKVKAVRNGKPFSAYYTVYNVGEEGQGKTRIAAEWTREEGASIKLLPGTYDIVVENQMDAGKPTISFPGVVIESGKPVEKIADFSGGTLKVKATRNGKPFSAYATVTKSGVEDKTKIAGGWTRDEGASLMLQPGVYDLVVENQTDAGKPTVKFEAVTIEGGKTVEKVADFSGGTLKVKANRNGKPLSAMAFVYAAGEGEEKLKKQVTRGMTGNDGATFQLMPGVYDVVVENQADAGKPTVKFEAVTVEGGKTIEKVADFSGGTLKVKATRNGKPLSAMAIVYAAGEGEEKMKKQVTRAMTGNDGATFQLVPGVYDLLVENQLDAGKPSVTLQALTVEAGKTVEKTVDFAGGTLKVKAVKDGKPFSAMAIVYVAGEGEEKMKKQVTRAMTGNDGATFQLVPGVYDISVQDQAAKKTQEFKGVSIGANQTQSMEVKF